MKPLHAACMGGVVDNQMISRDCMHDPRQDCMQAVE